MQIICPKCNTIFLVSSKKFGLESRKVKCSKCEHIWVTTLKNLVSFPADQPTTDIVDDNNKSTKRNMVFLPAKVNQLANIPRYLMILPFVLIMLIASLSVMTVKYNLHARGIILGDEKHILLQDVKIISGPNATTRIIQCRLFNDSYFAVNIPMIRIRTYDKKQVLVNYHIFKNENFKLAPKTSVIVKTRFQDYSTEITDFDVSLGNDLLFMID